MSMIKAGQHYLVRTVVGIRLQQWHEYAKLTGSELLLRKHTGMWFIGMIGNKREGTQGNIQGQCVVCREQTFQGKVQDLFISWLYSIDGGFHFAKGYSLHGVTPWLARAWVLFKINFFSTLPPYLNYLACGFHCTSFRPAIVGFTCMNAIYAPGSVYFYDGLMCLMHLQCLKIYS